MFGPAGARRVPASLLLLTLALLGVAGWGVWSRAQAPTDGTTISPANGAVSFGRIVVSDVGSGSPLRVGDEIVAIDGVDLAERAGRLPGGARGHVGDVVTYEVRRDGETRTVEVTLRHYPVLHGLAGWWPMLLVVALLLATSVTVVWARPRDPAARAALLTSGIGIVATVGAGFFPLAALDLVAGDQFCRWYAGETSPDASRGCVPGHLALYGAAGRHVPCEPADPAEGGDRRLHRGGNGFRRTGRQRGETPTRGHPDRQPG